MTIQVHIIITLKLHFFVCVCTQVEDHQNQLTPAQNLQKLIRHYISLLTDTASNSCRQKCARQKYGDNNISVLTSI